MIRRILTVAAAATLSLVGAQSVSAQTASVTYEITAINEASFTGTPAKLLIDAASKLSGVSDASTTWSVTTNQTDMKVQGAVTALPTGVTLEVELGEPTGAVSTKQSLGATAQDLVTGVTTLQAADLPVTYTLSATPTAGVVSEATATVTYTVVAGT